MEPLELEPDGTGTVGTGFWGIHWDQKLNFGLEYTKQYFETSYGSSSSRGIRW